MDVEKIKIMLAMLLYGIEHELKNYYKKEVFPKVLLYDNNTISLYTFVTPLEVVLYNIIIVVIVIIMIHLTLMDFDGLMILLIRMVRLFPYTLIFLHLVVPCVVIINLLLLFIDVVLIIVVVVVGTLMVYMMVGRFG